uniref:growth-regulating factor 3 n=1 Tax=Erigeron canadensis TaxID=72917 RepID=UPI001CB96598|nr:growth-regulating factor 3 [Erigeron canadensis]
MDFHHHHHHHEDSSSLALPLFSSEPTSSSSTKPSKEMMQGMSSGYFSMGQWQELEIQALIYRHMLTGSPIPAQLLHLLLNSNSNSTNSNSPFYPLSNFPTLYQTGGGYWGKGGMDPEPGRCRRTDGKKWRCSRDVVAGHKYCERHIHRGRNRSRKPVEIPTPTTTVTTTTNHIGGALPYATLASGGSSSSSSGVSGHSPFFDQLHLNQRSSSQGKMPENIKSSGSQVLRPFFDDWPRTVQEQEMLATSLSISVPGDAPSDFSLKLSTGNNDSGRHGEEMNGERERAPLNWGMLWGTNNAGSMGGPLAEALRSSSTSNSSSPTSVLHQLQRGSTTTSETSYVTT